LPPGFQPPNPVEEIKTQMETLKDIQERKNKFKEGEKKPPLPVKLSIGEFTKDG